MASLQKEPTGIYHIVIRFDGRRAKRSLKTRSRAQAEARLEEIEESVNLLARGRIKVPDGIPVFDFLLKGESATSKDQPAEPNQSAPRNVNPEVPVPETRANDLVGSASALTLADLLKSFFDSIPAGSLEQTTLNTMRIHQRHLLRVMGPRFEISSLRAAQIQAYINARAKEPTQKIADKSLPKKKQTRVPVSAGTIRKELVTLGSAWRWAVTMELIRESFPDRGLRWPKTDEKPPFQTWDEIERQIDQDRLTSADADLLWDCLYLRQNEVNELLNYVRQHARYSYVYPMFAMAAYTGARRSELIRSRKSDFDFLSGTITIRERKRVKGKRSTRRVPICEKLRPILLKCLDSHPGNAFTFAKQNRHGIACQLTVSQVQTQFKNTLMHGRWAPVKGWHCLRHSFISNLASAGVDQRIIDDFVGHTTEEMRRRYRHLLPDVKQAALDSVFS